MIFSVPRNDECKNKLFYTTDFDLLIVGCERGSAGRPAGEGRGVSEYVDH